MVVTLRGHIVTVSYHYRTSSQFCDFYVSNAERRNGKLRAHWSKSLSSIEVLMKRFGHGEGAVRAQLKHGEGTRVTVLKCPLLDPLPFIKTCC